MARYLILFTVILQVSLIFANIENEEHDASSQHDLEGKQSDKVKEFRSTDTEWLDLFTLPKINSFPKTSSASKMAQVLDTEKSPEEQIEDMKELTNQIHNEIHKELENLLSYLLKDTENVTDENSLREKRSTESPMGSTKLIMQLLNHIKQNNEDQNIAIEKMMTAQEIADKFGIDFTPDPDIFTELAEASTKKSKDLSTILKDFYSSKNITNQIDFMPLNNEPAQSSKENNTYYVYSTNAQKEEIAEQMNAPPHFDFAPEYVDSRLPVHRMHYEPVQHNYYYNIPVETQIPPPVHSHASVSHIPKFYEPSLTPSYAQCYPEPITTTTTIILPTEDHLEPEPELVGEEFEETVSSKVMVDRGDEPGSATVNHVMTYSISEKSHFRTPQIDSLPQQFQYYFFLM